MNRKQFLRLFTAGITTVVIAPALLVPKPEELGPTGILTIQRNLMHDIANMPISQWGGWYIDQGITCTCKDAS